MVRFVIAIARFVVKRSSFGPANSADGVVQEKRGRFCAPHVSRFQARQKDDLESWQGQCALLLTTTTFLGL